jgi:hypothetical protein
MAMSSARPFAASSRAARAVRERCRQFRGDGREGRRGRSRLRAEARASQLAQGGDDGAGTPQVLDRGPQRVVGPALARGDNRDSATRCGTSREPARYRSPVAQRGADHGDAPTGKGSGQRRPVGRRQHDPRQPCGGPHTGGRQADRVAVAGTRLEPAHRQPRAVPPGELRGRCVVERERVDLGAGLCARFSHPGIVPRRADGECRQRAVASRPGAAHWLPARPSGGMTDERDRHHDRRAG